MIWCSLYQHTKCNPKWTSSDWHNIYDVYDFKPRDELLHCWLWTDRWTSSHAPDSKCLYFSCLFVGRCFAVRSYRCCVEWSPTLTLVLSNGARSKHSISRQTDDSRIWITAFNRTTISNWTQENTKTTKHIKHIVPFQWNRNKLVDWRKVTRHDTTKHSSTRANTFRCKFDKI